MNRPLPGTSYGSYRPLKISASDFSTMGMLRQFSACAYEFLTMVTKRLVQGVHNMMIRSPFSVIWRHKLSLGIGHFPSNLPADQAVVIQQLSIG